MCKKSKLTNIVIIAVIAALYVVLNTVLGVISFGIIQLRLVCMLYLLARYDNKYIYACVLGNLLSNIFSPLGFIDVVFGALAAISACTVFRTIKNKWVSAIISAFAVGLIIGIELYITYGGILLLNIMTISISQLIVYCIGNLFIPKIYNAVRK